MYLRQRSDIITREIDGEMVVLNHRLGQVHQFNTTASYVWNRCDGRTTVEQIVDMVSKEYGISAVDIGEDIANIIAEFIGKELVDSVDNISPEL